MSQFDIDLERGHKAELLVRDILAGLTDEVTFKWVGDDPECYHKGDIKAFAADRVYYIEVKDDTCIATTGNILCEERVYNKNTGGEKKGFMYSDYDIYCVASQSERKLYFFDFKVMKDIYKRFGDFKMIHHPTQYSDCYLLEYCRIKQFGGVIKVVEY